MLVARRQLDFIRSLVAHFERTDGTMQPFVAYEAQYIAIITLLRSVGHVFEKVDCEPEERKAWCKTRWEDWKQAPIFRDFIEPARNELLKQFQGGLKLRQDGFDLPIIVHDPTMPTRSAFTRCSIRTSFETAKAVS